MQHCTPEQLALAALREPLPPGDAAHLAHCAQCRADVASWQRSVDALAVPQLAAPGAPVAPPARVWAAIAAATGVSTAPRSVSPVASAPQPAAEPAPAAEPPPNVVPLRRGRRRTALLVAAAAVVGAVIGAGAVVGVRGGNDGVAVRGGNDGVAVQSVALAPLNAAHASGSAVVLERHNGTRVLRLDLKAPGLDHAYYEAWLLQPDIKGMVPLGMVESGQTDFELPAGLDLGRFPLIDVSVEPLDGNPAHSGDSVVRGELKT